MRFKRAFASHGVGSQGMENGKIVVLFLHANNYDIGGADYCLFKLVSSLDSSKFFPIVGLSLRTEIVDLYEKTGICVKILDMKRLQKTLNPVKLIGYMLGFPVTLIKLCKLVRVEGIDLIHSNDLLDIYGGFAARCIGIPCLQYVRMIVPSPAWLRRVLSQTALRTNNVVTVVSDGVARSMFQSNGQRPSNVMTFYDWIDMASVGHTKGSSSIRQEYGISENVPVVGVVGRLETWKGQHVFIKAASHVLKHFPETVFIIVGGTVRGKQEYKEYLQKLVSDLGVEKSVIFTGERRDIYSVMSSFDVSIHSSTEPDPLPGTIMEAMYCEKPVIGADSGGVPEEIENGVTGLLYRPGDDADMASKICQLLANPGMARKMGTAGKLRLQKMFSKASQMPEIEHVYQSLYSAI